MEKKELNQSRQKIYEIGYLIVPTVAEENVPAEVQTIKNLIESKGAAFITEDTPKMRLLAYQMIKSVGSQHSKFDKGYFGWIKLEIEPTAIPVLKSELDKNNNLLRYLIIETVRENTLVGQKVMFRPSPTGDKEKSEDEPKMTEEEIDKTIENLVVE